MESFLPEPDRPTFPELFVKLGKEGALSAAGRNRVRSKLICR